MKEEFIAGRNPVAEALRSGRALNKVMVQDGARGVTEIIAAAREKGVAVEFVKMLLRPTVGNTLELLIMALSRYVVLNHHEPVSLAIGIAGVVALFATRRFLSGRPEGGKDDRISSGPDE